MTWQFCFFLTLCFVTLSFGEVYPEDFTRKRKEMVDRQISARGVRDPRVLEAMLKVERHVFVPEEMRGLAYEDMPLPIGYGQTISQPFIVGYMTDALRLQKEDRVLEIGTGSGYQAAILAEIAERVYTIEIIPELAKEAETRLSELGYRNITVKCADGHLGWAEEAPFDAIIVTAAPEEVPEKLLEQLKIGGRMVIPIGSFSGELYLITKTQTGIGHRRLLPVRFVPMVRGEGKTD